MRVMLKLLTSFFVLTMFTACITVPRAFDFGETEEFDGTWTGALMLSIGTATCARRTQITVTIENGGLDGKTKYKNFNAVIRGFIREDGSLTNGEVEVSKDYYSYEFTGQFEGENAKGKWFSKDCNGKWELRRVRRSIS